MRHALHVTAVSSSLCSLGAHLGHVKVDAYQSLSYYVLGGRSFFVIIDLDKTVTMLKSALLFFEHLILHYGHVVFCHSSIAQFSVHFKYFLSRIVNSRNQSFSYLKWLPGCVTNYRYIFLRLVELFFSDVRDLSHLSAMDLHIRLSRSYNISFFSYYRKLWFWFLNKYNFSFMEPIKLHRLKSLFNLFFFRCKTVLLNKYLLDVYDRDVVTNNVVRRKKKGFIFDSSYRRARYQIGKKRKIKRKYNKKMVWNAQLRWYTLPSFVSLLFRVCHVFKKREYQIRDHYSNVRLDNEVLFHLIFDKLHAFWRAIIFFRCFIKTSNLPDCLVLFNPDNSTSEFNDFSNVNLPIICLADTTTDIEYITYPIASNDDSIILFLFYFFLFINACEHAQLNRFIYSSF